MPPIFRFIALIGLALGLAIGTVVTLNAIRNEIGIARDFFAVDTEACTQPYREDGFLTVNDESLTIEIANTDSARRRGLSGRSCIQSGQGMLFVFDGPAILPFWMNDMYFPIDMIWIRDGVVVEVADRMQPASETLGLPVTHQPSAEADMVLEIGSGEAERLGIEIGSRVQIIQEN